MESVSIRGIESGSVSLIISGAGSAGLISGLLSPGNKKFISLSGINSVTGGNNNLTGMT
jgi:hypothetical protein